MHLTSSQVGLDGGVHITLPKLRAVVCEVIPHYRDPIERKTMGNCKLSTNDSSVVI